MDPAEIKNDFYARVYDIVALIPRGKVVTYGQIAALLGAPQAARRVGYAMYNAPAGSNLPCHRVINARGEMAPGTIFGSPAAQRKLLEQEGIIFKPDGCADLVKCRWMFDSE